MNQAHEVNLVMAESDHHRDSADRAEGAGSCASRQWGSYSRSVSSPWATSPGSATDFRRRTTIPVWETGGEARKTPMA